MIGEYTDEDICVYTVERSIEFWEKGEILMGPILGSIGVLLIGAIIITIFVGIKKKKVKMIEYELSQFSSLKDSGESGKHQNFVDEDIA